MLLKIQKILEKIKFSSDINIQDSGKLFIHFIEIENFTHNFLMQLLKFEESYYPKYLINSLVLT